MVARTLIVFLGLSVAGATFACAQEKQKDVKNDKMEMSMQGEHHDEMAEGHSHEVSELHGGTSTMTPDHHFETLFTPEEIRIYAYTGKQMPINEMKDVKASLTLQKKGGEPEEMAMEYVGPDADAGRSQGYFVAHHDLGEVKEGQMKATFMVSGLSKEPVNFKTPVALSDPVTYACPMHPEAMGEDPGSCSACGMALVKQGHDMHEDEHEGHNH